MLKLLNVFIANTSNYLIIKTNYYTKEKLVFVLF